MSHTTAPASNEASKAPLYRSLAPRLLLACCCPEDEGRGPYAVQHPFRSKDKSGADVVATTDGCIICMMPIEYAAAWIDSVPKCSIPKPTIHGLQWDAPYSNPVDLPEPDEKYKTKQECGQCDGQGVEFCNLGHEHECRDCDGFGKCDIIEPVQVDKSEWHMNSQILVNVWEAGLRQVRLPLDRNGKVLSDKPCLFEVGMLKGLIMPIKPRKKLE